MTGVVLFHTLFEAVAIPTAQAAVAEAAPGEAVASGQGLAHAIGLATAGVVSLLSPAVYGWAGAGLVYSGSAVMMVLLLGVAMIYDARARATETIEPVAGVAHRCGYVLSSTRFPSGSRT